MNNIKLISHRTIVTQKVDNCIKAAQKEMAEAAVEWVQEQMLYGYSDPHGSDGHTEIWWPDHDPSKGPHMADSIQAEVKRDSQNAYTVSVGSDKDYAKYVHNGTHKLKARPFLTDALEKNQDKQKAIYMKYLKKV